VWNKTAGTCEPTMFGHVLRVLSQQRRDPVCLTETDNQTVRKTGVPSMCDYSLHDVAEESEQEKSAAVVG